MINIELPQMSKSNKLEVVVNLAGLSTTKRARIARVFSHLLNQVVQERAPLWRRPELRNEEGVLLAAFVGCEKHAAVPAPLYVVEVDGWFDRRPGHPVARVPDLDYALVGGEDFGVGGLMAGGGGGVEEGKRFDGEA